MNTKTKAWIALIFICIVWGTTYLYIKVGVEHYPPFLFAGVRQVVSGLIIMTWAYIANRKVDLSLKSLSHQALVGFLMITLGNGFVTWSEQYVPSGVAALICGLMPVAAVVINLIMSKGKDRINWLIGAGMILGIGGIGLIFRSNLKDLADPKYLAGIGLLLVATTSWALGSIFNKKRAVKTNPIFNSGLQLLFGGIFLFGGSPIMDDYSKFELINSEGLWALAYLIVFGSVLAYTAYIYCLEKLPIGIVTSYAYVNPLVAVVMGYFMKNEPLTIWTGFAFLAIIGGVFVVNQGYRKQHRDKEVRQSKELASQDVELIEQEFAK